MRGRCAAFRGHEVRSRHRILVTLSIAEAYKKCYNSRIQLSNYGLDLAIVLFVGIETPEGGRILGFGDSGGEDLLYLVFLPDVINFY